MLVQDVTETDEIQLISTVTCIVINLAVVQLDAW